MSSVTSCSLAIFSLPKLCCLRGKPWWHLWPSGPWSCRSSASFPLLCSPELGRNKRGCFRFLAVGSDAPFTLEDGEGHSPRVPISSIKALNELSLWHSALRRSDHSCSKRIEGALGNILPSPAMATGMNISKMPATHCWEKWKHLCVSIFVSYALSYLLTYNQGIAIAWSRAMSFYGEEWAHPSTMNPVVLSKALNHWGAWEKGWFSSKNCFLAARLLLLGLIYRLLCLEDLRLLTPLLETIHCLSFC